MKLELFGGYYEGTVIDVPDHLSSPLEIEFHMFGTLAESPDPDVMIIDPSVRKYIRMDEESGNERHIYRCVGTVNEGAVDKRHRGNVVQDLGMWQRGT